MNRAACCLLALLSAATPAPAADVDVYANPSTFQERALQPGDPAPPLRVEAWVKGEPVPRFEPGRVYVVEFWATWCQPCRKSIPELSELQRTRGKDGLRVIGVAASEEDGLAGVQDFVARVPMDYAVAFAGEATFTAWMHGARNSGLPWAFVIDRQGRVAWWGQPFYAEFPGVVEEVLAGRWSAADHGKQRRARGALEKEGWALQAQLATAREQKDAGRMLTLIDRLLALDPQRYWWEAVQKLGLLLDEDPALGLQFARDCVAGISRQNPHALSAIGERLAARNEPGARDLALAAVRQAGELTRGESPDVLASLAAVHAARGERAEAVAALEKALPRLAGEERAAVAARLRELRGAP